MARLVDQAPPRMQCDVACSSCRVARPARAPKPVQDTRRKPQHNAGQATLTMAALGGGGGKHATTACPYVLLGATHTDTRDTPEWCQAPSLTGTRCHNDMHDC